VHNAEIKTAAVEIKTLTITGKQVTLAVFRQLLQEDLIGEDLASESSAPLKGIPWGIVNYHPDRITDPDDYNPWSSTGRREIPCERANTHLHVIWQMGSELRRAIVWHPAAFKASNDLPDGDPELPVYREIWRQLSDLPQLFIAV
jgi:hypothetical protein